MHSIILLFACLATPLLAGSISNGAELSPAEKAPTSPKYMLVSPKGSIQPLSRASRPKEAGSTLADMGQKLETERDIKNTRELLGLPPEWIYDEAFRMAKKFKDLGYNAESALAFIESLEGVEADTLSLIYRTARYIFLLWEAGETKLRSEEAAGSELDKKTTDKLDGPPL